MTNSKENFLGKNILLLIPNFHQYTQLVIDDLKKKGANVVVIENKHFFLDYRVQTTFLRKLRKLMFILLRPDIRYFRQKIELVISGEIKFDYLFSINCDALSPILFDYLDKYHPNLKKILYLWDSLTIFKYSQFLKYFDRVLSFDPLDAKQYNLQYLPNFIIPDNTSNEKKIYDLFFVGQQTGERFIFINKVYDLSITLGLNVYIKLVAVGSKRWFVTVMYNLVKYLKFIKPVRVFCSNYEMMNNAVEYPFILRRRILFDEWMFNLRRSKCIVDVCFEDQSGYSHRIMQALYYGLKIITNNKSILNEKFYSEDYIKFLDIHNPVIDKNWINSPYKASPAIFKKYELGNWLNIIFSTDDDGTQLI